MVEYPNHVTVRPYLVKMFITLTCQLCSHLTVHSKDPNTAVMTGKELFKRH